MLKEFCIIGLGLYFALLIFIVAKSKKDSSLLDYFFGGRKLPFWALSISFIASWWGAGSAIATADLAYQDGIGAFWYYGVPVLFATFLITLSAKHIRKIGALTQGEIMQSRYSPLVAKILALMIVIFMTLNAGSQMVALGDFFGAFLGLDYTLALVVGTSVVLLYSIIGGFKAVILTDILQFVLLFISALAVFFVALYYSGGFENIAEVALSREKQGYTDFFASSGKYFVYVIVFGFSWSIQANVWQRVSAVKDEGDARKMAIMSFVVFVPLYLIVVFTGMSALPLFETLPEGGAIQAIILNYMPPVLAVFVIIGITSAIMSTMDSLINTAAMTLVLDLSKFKKASQAKKVFYSKIATLVLSLIAMFFALNIRSILDLAWIASDIITTGIFIPLVLGFLWKRGNTRGAIASMLWGIAYCSYNFLIFIGIALPKFWQLQSASQVIFGVGTSLALYIVMSLCKKES
ncbi:MAG: sodium:solute symporter family protein [Opitutales bacterium]